MKLWRTIMRHPLTNIVLSVYWIWFAWWTDSWIIGILGGMLIVSYIDTTSDWFHDRAVEREGRRSG